MIKKGIVFVAITAMNFPCVGQNTLNILIHKDSLYTKYKEVFDQPEKYHLQMIYTQVSRDQKKHVVLKRYLLEPPTKRYYYPASLVKLPLAALALEKINELKIKGLTKDTRLCIDSSFACETRECIDTTSVSGYPSIAQYIKRMLLVSDNNAYTRTYEFLTPAYINQKLHKMGYVNATVNQRFKAGCDSTDNRNTNGFFFLDKDSNIIYEQLPACYNDEIKNRATHTVIGKAFQGDNNKLFPPKDFRRNNYIPFEDENEVLLSIIYPHAVLPSKRFNLKDEDYTFLREYMGMLPRESIHPTYDTSYHDNFKKYIYYGTTKNIDDTTIRSYNIVGRAYGFLADCSYIKDSKTGVEFFLSILIYVNKKNILNTNNYEYDTIGLPLMSDMGRVIYDYELKRKKEKEKTTKPAVHHKHT